MQPLKIVSMLKVNGEWVEQSTLPKHIADEMIRNTIIRAAKQIGFEETTSLLSRNEEMTKKVDIA